MNEEPKADEDNYINLKINKDSQNKNYPINVKETINNYSFEKNEININNGLTKVQLNDNK